jgi:hypothetical protein
MKIENRILPVTVNPEKLAYWYFRLNGFLTITNFVVHPEHGKEQRTDIDILGYRFPYRAELFDNPMADDSLFTKGIKKPYFVIAEVKQQTCNLNGPWTEKESQNMHRVLRAVGIFPENEVDIVAESLYKEGCFQSDNTYLTLFCLGNKINKGLLQRYPKVPQVKWSDVLTFIYERFTLYRKQKSFHIQWDSTGHNLWNTAMQSDSKEKFINHIKIETSYLT